MVEPYFCEEPFEELASIINRDYKNGVVGIVGRQDPELIAKLIKRGNTIEGDTEFGDHVRCIVGSGGYGEILSARFASWGKKLYLLPDICDKICFVPYMPNRGTENILTEPESVIYDYKKSNKLRPSAYAALCGLLAECADAAATRTSATLLVLLSRRVKAMLAAPLDIVEAAGFIAKAEGALAAAGGSLYRETAFFRQLSEMPSDVVFFTNYLIIAAFIQFTKYDFNGIFIGKDKTFLPRLQSPLHYSGRAVCESLSSREMLADILAGKESLSYYAERYLWERGGKHLKVPSPREIYCGITADEERVSDNGLLASLCRLGFIEGLI